MAVEFRCATARGRGYARGLRADADRLMRAAGLDVGDRVAILARNIPEFVEIAAAAFKARLTHVNINY